MASSRPRGGAGRSGRGFLPALVVCLIVGATYVLGGLGWIERRLTDVRFKLVQRGASGKVVVVAIDTKSLTELNVWPWVRSYHAAVLDELLAAGARRVAFDVDFSSPSIPEEDRELERAVAAAGDRVILPYFLQWDLSDPDEAALRETRPLPELRRHATLAAINIRPDQDGLVRSYDLRTSRGSWEVPSLAAVLANEHPGGQSFQIDFGIRPDSIPQVSFVDVLTGWYDPAVVNDRVVVVGATAVELGDQLAVPPGQVIPGPVLQAMAVESLWQGRNLTAISPWLILAVTFLIGIVVVPRLRDLPWRVGLAVVVGLASGAFTVSVLVQLTHALVLDISPLLLMLALGQTYALIAKTDQQAIRLLVQGVRLRRTQTLMQHVVDNSFDAIITTDEHGRIETVNPAAERLFGWNPLEARAKTIDELFESVSATSPLQPRDRVETEGRRRDGSTFPVELGIRPIAAEGHRGWVAFVRDITERKAHERELRHRATHDALTALPNRVLLLEHLSQTLEMANERCGNAAVLVMDLDRFKEVNDTLGHEIGDRLLCAIADRLRELLRPFDMLARLGGDEFAVLLPDTDGETVRWIGQRLAACLDRPFDIEGYALRVETSIGGALFPEHGSQPETLMQRADVAMYNAKRGPIPVCLYDPEEDFNSLRHLTLRTELRDAIEGDQLTLHFQPKISSATGKAVGVEALVRWVHPRHGMMPPMEFISLAEHSGLIRPLTRWVLAGALKECASWRERGHDLGVSVNLSARNLMEIDLPQSLAWMVASSGVPPEKLTLEFTESVIMEDPKRALEVVTQLDRLGVRISIDDFGTGYSSLGYLKRLPANELKIDRSFVKDMDTDPEDAMIVRSTIKLAHSLGLEVVAEGVETIEIWNVLRESGCDQGQGYYFSRPIPAEELAQWLEARETDPVGVV